MPLNLVSLFVIGVVGAVAIAISAHGQPAHPRTRRPFGFGRRDPYRAPPPIDHAFTPSRLRVIASYASFVNVLMAFAGSVAFLLAVAFMLFYLIHVAKGDVALGPEPILFHLGSAIPGAILASKTRNLAYELAARAPRAVPRARAGAVAIIAFNAWIAFLVVLESQHEQLYNQSEIWFATLAFGAPHLILAGLLLVGARDAASISE